MSAQDRYVVKVSSYLNVRCRADRNARILGKLKSEEEIIVMSIDGDWAEFIWKDNNLAYTSRKYLEYVGKYEDPDFQYQTCYKVINDSLNLMSHPSSSSEILGHIPVGAMLDADRIDADWAHVSYDDHTGYVCVKYIQKTFYKVPVTKMSDVAESQVHESVQNYVPQNTCSRISRFVESLPNCAMPAVMPPHTGKNSLFLSAGLDSGISCFTWSEGPVRGAFSLTLNTAVQFYANERLRLLPKGYYGECSLGYAMKGANGLRMHYINIDLLPVGYFHKFDRYNIVSKLGIYTGVPLSTLKHTTKSNFDVGFSCGVALEYRLLSAGLTFDHGFVPVAESPIKLYNWCLMLQFRCKILSLIR